MKMELIPVDFPLRGEWEAEHTPADRVPSHGTDQLAQTYAYDFVRIEIERKGLKFFRGSLLRYFLLGVNLEECYGWSEPIFAPFSGNVVTARDGWPERRRLHLLRDLAVVLGNALLYNFRSKHDLRSLLGNHIILKMADRDVFACFAHIRTGSIRVRDGDFVNRGQRLAEVGHSGNSTAPHLHFQLMDHEDILRARGLPCIFTEYEAYRDGKWTRVVSGMPEKRELIRCRAYQQAWNR